MSTSRHATASGATRRVTALGLGFALALTLFVVLPCAASAAQRWVGDDGLVVAGKARCAAASACKLAAPKWVKLGIAGNSYRVRVIAPEQLPAGGSALVQVRLGGGVVRSLAGKRAMLRIRLVVRVDGKRSTRLFELALRRPGKSGEGARGDGGGRGAGPGIKSAPIVNEPPLLARPATAVDVSGVRVTWFPRDSWVRYASSGVGAGDGISAVGGAVGTNSTASPCPDRPSVSDAQLPHAIDFAPRPSWYDPVSGSAGVYGQGSVSFRWKAHTIDLTASDPEIEIAGPASRAIFRFGGSGGTPYPNQRASLVSLDTAGRPTLSNGGKTLTYDLMRGTLTPDGVSVFAGFYTPPDNDEFGCVSVSFTLP